MRSILFILSILLLSFFTAYAADTNKTQAGWFEPGCTDCPKLQTPGTASLGNTKGVYRPKSATHKKPEEKPADTHQ